MKDGALVSTSEKTFLLQAVNENLRLDDRQFNEHRKRSIYFGSEWGSCLVLLGETRVLAQVSCDIQQPKASKPNEGLLYVHVEMSPMTSLQSDSKGQSDISVQVNRLLEKCLRESKCVDLEALCIVAEEKVWNIRIDLNVMNFDGNLAGCCSIAALAALAHFKHPDVTSTGDQIIIHSHSEKEPISITLHHYPVIISYALFNSGKQILIDPTALEERVADSLLMLSVNTYHEICGMHLEGASLPSVDVVIKCTKSGVRVAEHLVKDIKQVLVEDERKRSQKGFGGLSESLNLNHILAKVQENMKIDLRVSNPWKKEICNSENVDKIKIETDEENGDEEKTETAVGGNEYDADASCSKYSIKSVAKGTAELEVEEEDLESVMSYDSEGSNEIQVLHQETRKKVEEIQLSGDSDNSEEDEIVVLQSTFK